MVRMIRLFTYMFLPLLIAVLPGSGGCGGAKMAPGRFSEQEMANLPLAGQRDLPPPSSGTMVISVSGEAITVDEIISPLAEGLRQSVSEGFDAFRLRAAPVVESVVQEKIIEILLYQKARKKAPENIEEAIRKAVEGEVNRFVAQYGNNLAEAQKAIAEMGLDWEGFRKYQQKLILVQSYISGEISGDLSVSYGEMLGYYNAVRAKRFQWEGQIEFRIIDIVMEQLKPEQVDAVAGQSKRQAALRIAGGILERIKQGQDFGEMAKTHSHGYRASLGGLWRPVTPGVGSLARPYDVLEAAAMGLNPGQVFGPVESGGHIFIVKLEKKKEPGVASFKDVQDIVEREVRMIKQKQRYDDLIAGIVANTRVRNVDRFVDFCVTEAYRRYSNVTSSQAERDRR